jgi:beta-lactam-binding protein with PASTA domain
MPAQKPPYKRPPWLTQIKEEAEGNSLGGFLLHVLGLVLLLILSVGLFFWVYLPLFTQHGEALTVPSVRGMALTEAEPFLRARDMRVEVADSSFSPEYPPMTVLSQRPAAGSQVKKGRMIYLTVNARRPPTVKVPNVLDISLKNAEQQLQSYGFRLGDIVYVPHPHSGRVLGMRHDSTDISADMLSKGFFLPKNTPIHLQVGDGIGEAAVKLPNLVGMPMDEAEIYLLGLGLHLSKLHWMPASKAPIGQVLQQKPGAGAMLPRNQGVEIWVSGKNPNDISK